MNGTVGAIDHFGSLYGETDYRSKAHYLSLNLNFAATEKLNLLFTGGYVKSEASFDKIIMPEVPEEVEAEIAPGYYSYDMIDEYSDLSYSQLELEFGGEYRLAERTSLNARISYIDLNDDEGYVYGIESGSMTVVRTWINFGF